MKDEHKRDVRMEEEKRRMRNHVLKEVDTNKDKMVSLDEFMRYTDTKEFDTPEKDSYKVNTTFSYSDLLFINIY